MWQKLKAKKVEYYNNYFFYYGFGKLCKNDIYEAISGFSNHLKYQPSDPYGIIFLAFSKLGLGDKKGACNDLKLMLKLENLNDEDRAKYNKAITNCETLKPEDLFTIFDLQVKVID